MCSGLTASGASEWRRAGAKEAARRGSDPIRRRCRGSRIRASWRSSSS
jgi:hypothetical protein